MFLAESIEAMYKGPTGFPDSLEVISNVA